MRKIQRIGNTPLSISVYSAKQTATTLHERGTLEIIFCLKGSVKFSYAYEEFTLYAGEYISVDRDAYYLYDGKENVCVSLYFDLNHFTSKYPFICDNLFVCEGCGESEMEYPTRYHNLLKGMMIALLKHISDGGDDKITTATTERIIDTFVEHFDILYFHTRGSDIRNNQFARIREINHYLQTHIKEKITITELAKKINVAPGYVSEIMRKNSVGFRGMLAYLRANNSESLLLNTNKTILEISEECGFSDVKYYYSAFRKWYKCTPKQFRVQYGDLKEENLEPMELKDIALLLDELMQTHYMDTFLGHRIL